MTDIQLPDAVLDLFAAFDIADPARILILLLGGILALLLVLIILIAARGRTAPAAASVSDTTEPPRLNPAEQAPAVAAPDMPVAPSVDTSPLRLTIQDCNVLLIHCDLDNFVHAAARRLDSCFFCWRSRTMPEACVNSADRSS